MAVVEARQGVAVQRSRLTMREGAVIIDEISDPGSWALAFAAPCHSRTVEDFIPRRANTLRGLLAGASASIRRGRSGHFPLHTCEVTQP